MCDYNNMTVKELNKVKEEFILNLSDTRIYFGADTAIEILRREGITADNRAIGSFLQKMCDMNPDHLFEFDHWDKTMQDKYTNDWLGKNSLPQRGHVYLVAIEHIPVLLWNVVKHFRKKEVEKLEVLIKSK